MAIKLTPLQLTCCRQFGEINDLPIKVYDKNLLMDDKARPVIGPVVSSDLTTSRNGVK